MEEASAAATGESAGGGSCSRARRSQPPDQPPTGKIPTRGRTGRSFLCAAALGLLRPQMPALVHGGVTWQISAIVLLARFATTSSAAARPWSQLSGVQQISMRASAHAPTTQTLLGPTASGFAHVETSTLMTAQTSFRIASNSKFFTAVAIYQLQERGLINVSVPVTQYLDTADYIKFGVRGATSATRWCPKSVAYARNTTAACQVPTTEQLLSMTAGILDVNVCSSLIASNTITRMLDLVHHCQQIFAQYPYMMMYGGNSAFLFGSVFNAPLLFEPGSQYSYSNTNFVLAAYLIEKLSGLSLSQYFKANIFDVIGLTDTYFDVHGGTLQLDKALCSEYRQYINKTNGALLGVGQCGFDFAPGALAGAAGLRSTVSDFHIWWEAIFRPDWHTALVQPESLQALLRPRVATGNGMHFAQGILVSVRPPAKFPNRISYCGGAQCSFTCNTMVFLPNGGWVIASAWSNMQYINTTNADYEALQNVNDARTPADGLTDPSITWMNRASSSVFSPVALPWGLTFVSQRVVALLDCASQFARHGVPISSACGPYIPDTTKPAQLANVSSACTKTAGHVDLWNFALGVIAGLLVAVAFIWCWRKRNKEVNAYVADMGEEMLVNQDPIGL